MLGNFGNQSIYIKEIEANAIAGTPYDIYAGYSMSIASISYMGYSENLDEYNNIIDFDMPWWPDSLLSESVINNKLYFVSGDISTNFLHSMYACFFNKEMIIQYSLEDPYPLALAGDWTLDKLIGMSTNIYLDIDGNTTKSVDDQFGFFTNTVHLDGFFTGSGLRTTDKDASGGTKLTEAAYMLECLASELYRKVTPIVFERSMKVKYANDETTAQIYNIIRESAIFDVGCIFTMNLGGGITYSFVRNTLSQNTATTYSFGYSTIKKQLSTYLNQLSKTLG